MLAVKDNITSKLIDKHDTLEVIVVSVSCSNNKNIFICLLYVPPDVDQSQHETLLEYLSTPILLSPSNYESKLISNYASSNNNLIYKYPLLQKVMAYHNRCI